MNKNQKGFIVPVILVIIAALAVGGGTYFYTKNKVKKSAGSEVPNSFATYNSPIGFSISYPNDWSVNEVRGVDASFGGVELSSPGTHIKNGRYLRGDTLEQFISVNAGVALRPLSFQEMKTSFAKGFEKQYLSITRAIIEQKDIKIDGTDAYEIVYSENDTKDNSSSKNIAIFLLADPTGVQNKNLSQLGTSIIISYQARSDVFDQNLAEKIIGTLKESILKTYEEKSIAARSKVQADPQAESTAKVRSILANLRATIEMNYEKNHNSYASLCSNGIININADGNTQTSVKGITDALKVSSQSTASIKCFSTQQKYALSVQIAENNTLCIDSTGEFKNGVADKTTITCK